MESNDDSPNSESVSGSEPRHEPEINPDDKLMIDYDAILVRDYEFKLSFYQANL